MSNSSQTEFETMIQVAQAIWNMTYKQLNTQKEDNLYYGIDLFFKRQTKTIEDFEKCIAELVQGIENNFACPQALVEFLSFEDILFDNSLFQNIAGIFLKCLLSIVTTLLSDKKCFCQEGIINQEIKEFEDFTCNFLYTQNPFLSLVQFYKHNNTLRKCIQMAKKPKEVIINEISIEVKKVLDNLSKAHDCLIPSILINDLLQTSSFIQAFEYFQKIYYACNDSNHPKGDKALLCQLIGNKAAKDLLETTEIENQSSKERKRKKEVNSEAKKDKKKKEKELKAKEDEIKKKKEYEETKKKREEEKRQKDEAEKKKMEEKEQRAKEFAQLNQKKYEEKKKKEYEQKQKKNEKKQKQKEDQERKKMVKEISKDEKTERNSENAKIETFINTSGFLSIKDNFSISEKTIEKVDNVEVLQEHKKRNANIEALTQKVEALTQKVEFLELAVKKHEALLQKLKYIFIR